jgi:hypothetical protein
MGSALYCEVGEHCKGKLTCQAIDSVRNVVVAKHSWSFDDPARIYTILRMGPTSELLLSEGLVR